MISWLKLRRNINYLVAYIGEDCDGRYYIGKVIVESDERRITLKLLDGIERSIAKKDCARKIGITNIIRLEGLE